MIGTPRDSRHSLHLFISISGVVSTNTRKGLSVPKKCDSKCEFQAERQGTPSVQFIRGPPFSWWEVLLNSLRPAPQVALKTLG